MLPRTQHWHATVSSTCYLAVWWKHDRGAGAFSQEHSGVATTVQSRQPEWWCLPLIEGQDMHLQAVDRLLFVLPVGAARCAEERCCWSWWRRGWSHGLIYDRRQEKSHSRRQVAPSGNEVSKSNSQLDFKGIRMSFSISNLLSTSYIFNLSRTNSLKQKAPVSRSHLSKLCCQWGMF